jgi:hypothetical protein
MRRHALPSYAAAHAVRAHGTAWRPGHVAGTGRHFRRCPRAVRCTYNECVALPTRPAVMPGNAMATPNFTGGNAIATAERQWRGAGGPACGNVGYTAARLFPAGRPEVALARGSHSKMAVTAKARSKFSRIAMAPDAALRSRGFKPSILTWTGLPLPHGSCNCHGLPFPNRHRLPPSGGHLQGQILNTLRR